MISITGDSKRHKEEDISDLMSGMDRLLNELNMSWSHIRGL